MNKILFIITLCITSLCSCTTNKKLYLKDLDYIYKTIKDNHPGIYNDQDPTFNEKLEKNYTHTKTEIINSSTDSEPKKSIDNFTKSFHDSHLLVNWKHNAKKQTSKIIGKFSLSQLSQDISWITLPTFDLNNSQKNDFEQLIQNISKLQHKKYIVFDLRTNQGGNSLYGSKIINALFGEEYADQKRCVYDQNVYVDWRASKDNLDHISSFLIKHPNNWLQNVEYGLKESITQNKNYYREKSSENCALNNYSIEKKPTLDTKIIAVIDSLNFSAALDFLDELKMMTEHLTLIGQTTKSDRLYMESRSVLLPSGLGHLSFPIKVYRNRLRLDDQPYTPNIHHPNTNNTTSLEKLIIQKLKENRIL